MNPNGQTVKVAVLDDYQGVALKLADWAALRSRAEVTVFNDHLASADAVVERLRPFDVVCVMRERTPLRRAVIERLPNLKLIASTGKRNASIDADAAGERGIAIVHTSYTSTPTVELTWALILASARHLVSIGSQVAKVGLAFGMQVIAWSQNLTAQRAAAEGTKLVSKQDLLREADVVSIHLVLSDRTRGLIGAPELALMKPTARLVNTSRGPLVEEAALLSALASRQIAGAAIDVFDIEPLPPEHPYRHIEHMLATPHIGYVSRGLYQRFYGDTVANILAWLDARPNR